MTAFPNNSLDEDLCHGDLLIQFCAETPEEVLHALRMVIKATRTGSRSNGNRRASPPPTGPAPALWGPAAIFSASRTARRTPT